MDIFNDIALDFIVGYSKEQKEFIFNFYLELILGEIITLINFVRIDLVELEFLIMDIIILRVSYLQPSQK